MDTESLTKLVLFSCADTQADGKTKQHITAYIRNCPVKEYFDKYWVFRILVQTNNENADGMATPHIRIPL